MILLYPYYWTATYCRADPGEKLQGSESLLGGRYFEIGNGDLLYFVDHTCYSLVNMALNLVNNTWWAREGFRREEFMLRQHPQTLRGMVSRR
jgi:hypothetical protein